MRKKRVSSILLGLGFIFLAVSIFLRQLNIWPHIPLFLIISSTILTIWSVKSLLAGKWIESSVIVGILFAHLNNHFEWLDISFWQMILVMVLIGIGVSVMVGPGKRSKRCCFKQYSGEEINILFGGQNIYLEEKDDCEYFAKMTFGELTIYFNQLSRVGKPITLNLDASFGEVRLVVPREWEIEDNLSILFGESRVMSGTQGASRKLMLEGACRFSEVRVEYI